MSRFYVFIAPLRRGFFLKCGIPVKDNGQGLNLEQRDISIGVRSMENRVKLHEGTLQLNSSSHEGCTLLLTLPFA